MKQENKELLKDLCARLPYGFTIHRYSDNCDIVIESNGIDEFAHFLEYSEGEDFKPYLRPMSSMTEDEFQELRSICPHSVFNKTDVPGWIIGIDGSDYGRISRVDEISKLLDWLNKKMFDYRGLIPMDLALEAKEGMYKI